MCKILPLFLFAASCLAAEPAWLGDPVLADVSSAPNHHVYFRREMSFPAPSKAILRFAADDTATIFIDGNFVTEGPELGYPSAQPVAELDVTSFFASGERHVIAADVYYLGCVARSLSSGDGRFGFRAELEMSFADGSSRRIATDGGWKALVCKTRSTSRKPLGYGTQFNEDCDLRLEPRGWKTFGFDDSAWSCAVVREPKCVFTPSQGRPLQYVVRKPAQTRRCDDGTWIWDMGEEMCGTPVVVLKGATSGDRVMLKQAEELNKDGSLRFRLRCNCDYSDTFTLANGENTLDYFDYRAFRYVSLEGWKGERPEFTVRERHYPFDPSRTSFSCSDKNFEAIWKMCVRGLVVGTQDRFMDCPSREKGQYTGDAWMTAVPRWYITADPSIWRKSVVDFARSQSKEDPWLLCVAPGSFKQRLAEWSMLWAALAADYIEFTGDVTIAKELLASGMLERFAAGFRSLENKDGFHCDPEKKLWILTDWPANQRCGYDYDATIGKGAVNTWVNAFLYGMFRNLAKIHRAANDESGAAFHEKRAAELKDRFNRVFLDPVTGHYHDGLHADGSLSPKCSHQAGVGALYWGLVPDSAKAKVVEKIAAERTMGSLFSGFYAIAALAENGKADLAWELMAGDDAHSWSTMIKEGATTPFEAWSKEDKWNTSLCHPFASVPISLFARHFLGIRYVVGGMEWNPKPMKNLPAFELRLPLPDGGARIAAHTADGRFFLR